MCGIFAVFGGQDKAEFRQRANQLSKKLRHRGPDWSGVLVSGNNILCHERLAIVGLDSGAQPLTNADGSVILAVNGEIYNHVTLAKLLKTPRTFATKSDCEWEDFGPDFLKSVDGMFSFVLYDANKDVFFAARDHVGITTLYQGFRHDNSVWFASELKALNQDCDRILAFPPGHYYLSTAQTWTEYYHPQWFDHIKAGVPTLDSESKVLSPSEEETMYKGIRHSLELSVKKRLMSEVPYGVLLSGGLDSSLIASIAVRVCQSQYGLTAEDDDDVRSAYSMSSAWPGIHSFSIGLPGSPDLKAAAKVASFLGTVHHGFTFSVQEGLDAVFDVIYHLETYDVTTVRASTPMYLLSRKVKAMGVKMVLSGEGSDEIFGGYLYFHNAPSAQALHHECITRVRNLHTSDNLRANKSTMAWGLEARVPFLDKAFLEEAMLHVPANHKLTKQGPYFHPIEKYVLRKAFDTPDDPYLPEDVLWRQKEQFSDGVGYSWIDSLKAHAESIVSDLQLENAASLYPRDTPMTKEAYWYRQAFEAQFPQPACLESVVRWIPRADWGCNEDPSGRAQKVHAAAY